MIDLEPEYIDFIKQTVASCMQDFKLYIFGSRAKNKAQKYSDIDIAINSKELTSSVKSKLEFLFENSLLPYEVDIIDLNSITENFKNLIKDDLIELI